MLPWLRLMRLPNVFTALADVAMGYFLVHGTLVDGGKLACLAVASGLLYTAGMVLNDVFDYAVDAKERPFRPLPSGQIALPQARAVGFAMLALGVAFGWLAGYLPGESAAISWRSGAVATLLAGAVVLYDGWLKFTPVGPLGMGACRLLNVLLGMSASSRLLGEGPLSFSPAEWLAASGIGLYIVGVTWFARSEAEHSRRPALLAALTVMLLGVATLGATAAYHPATRLQTPWFWFLLAVMMLPVVRRCLTAVMYPEPLRVQAAIKYSILSLILLDAAVVALVAPPMYAFATAALLLPALFLGRWVYST